MYRQVVRLNLERQLRSIWRGKIFQVIRKEAMSKDDAEHLGSSDGSSSKLVDALGLLRRIRDWDHLASAADGRYWIGEIDSVLNNREGAGAADRCEQMRDALDRIRWLASWHCDLAADESDTSPEDQVAYVNGLIVLECCRALE